VHLDVKPSNLLFHEGQLMLCDFGSAGMREIGTIAGTRAYMAPEQRANGIAGPAADLYAAGLVIAESIEGHLSLQRGPPLQGPIVLSALQGGPRRRALEHVLSFLCARDPGERPTEGAVAAELLLEAGALPLGDREGAALFAHVESLAAREGEAAVARLRRHPLIGALRPAQAAV
jgi:serine/threonine protein kinase